MWYAGWENPDEIENCCFSRNAKIKNSKFWNACESPWVWRAVEHNPEAWMEIDLTAEDFDFNDHPIHLKLCWILPDGSKHCSDTSENTSTDLTMLGLVGDGRIDYESDFDQDEVNEWGRCEDECHTGTWEQTVDWSLKAEWGKCAFCDESIPYWDFWIRDNLAHLDTVDNGEGDSEVER